MPSIQEPTEDTMTDADPTAPAGSTGSESPKEDDATKATREELKHTMISEKLVGGFPIAHSQSAEQRRREATPEVSGLRARQADALRDQVGSPKKKRAHDEVSGDDDSRQHLARDKTGEPAEAVDATAHAASASDPVDTANGGSGEGGRSDRAEPEKKRLRDREAEEAAKMDKDVDTAGTDAKDAKDGTTAAKDKSAAPVATSSSAFAASGFSKLTSATSPFGALGAAAASGKPSLFGTASSAASPFGSLGGTAAKPAASATPKFSFGSAAGSASPFASVSGTTTGKLFPFSSTSTSGFGAASTASTAGGGFGSTISGPRLTSFAKPGELFKSDKPARPFGAPESDAEENAGGESGSGADEEENADEADTVEAGGSDAKDFEERAKTLGGGDEKKKPKLQKVEVNDGEKGEATLIQVRARMYYLDKDQGGWKERGAGMLKLNVPEVCVQFDEQGNAIPASFDASMLAPGHSDKDDSDSDSDKDKSDSGDANSEAGSSGTRAAATKKAAAAPARTVVRLIMRQDSTHRVILNTVVLAATLFQERQTLKSTTVLFTAFEGEDAKPVNVQMKMNAANAKAFISTVGGVQKELRDI